VAPSRRRAAGAAARRRLKGIEDRLMIVLTKIVAAAWPLAAVAAWESCVTALCRAAHADAGVRF
jgi:hypothetical protein